MCKYDTNTTEYYSCYGQHVHEYAGSTVFSESSDHCHNHRFAAVSGEAIPADGSHYHNLDFRTDTCHTHFHEFHGPSSLAIPIGDGRHIHFAKSSTTKSDGHTHEFRTALFINDPGSYY